VSVPPQSDVEQYIFNLEYKYPSIYEEWFNSHKTSPIDIYGIPVVGNVFMQAVKYGLIRPVIAELSDDEIFVLIKLWSPLEEEYKWSNNFDQADLNWFWQCCKYIGAVN
jgi:hypothetical protein